MRPAVPQMGFSPPRRAHFQKHASSSFVQCSSPTSCLALARHAKSAKMGLSPRQLAPFKKYICSLVCEKLNPKSRISPVQQSLGGLGPVRRGLPAPQAPQGHGHHEASFPTCLLVARGHSLGGSRGQEGTPSCRCASLALICVIGVVWAGPGPPV